MSEEKEIKNVILKSSKNLGSAFQVFKAMDGVKEELLMIFKRDLEAGLGFHGMKLVWDLESWPAYSGFHIQFGEFTQSLNLRFEFNRTNLNEFFWGIARSNKNYYDPHVWDEVNRLMRASFGSAKTSPHWPWYSELPDDVFGVEMQNWNISEKPWISIMDNCLVKKITDLAIRVQVMFKDHLRILHDLDSSTAAIAP